MTLESTVATFYDLAASYEEYRLSDWYKSQAELVVAVSQRFLEVRRVGPDLDRGAVREEFQ